MRPTLSWREGHNTVFYAVSPTGVIRNYSVGLCMYKQMLVHGEYYKHRRYTAFMLKDKLYVECVDRLHQLGTDENITGYMYKWFHEDWLVMGAIECIDKPKLKDFFGAKKFPSVLPRFYLARPRRYKDGSASLMRIETSSHCKYYPVYFSKR